MIETITNINIFINGLVWGWPALILLGFVGILMTFLTKFYQVTHFMHWVQNTIGAIFKDKNVVGHTGDKSISQFQSLCTALAATVGTGNIVGVAGAMYYLRNGLGAKKGCKQIGAVLAVLFSAFCLLASFGIGNMSQVNSMVSNIVTAGSIMEAQLAWDISDTFNDLMMIPNLIGVLVLSPLVAKCTKNYIDRNLLGKNVKPMLSMFDDIQKEQEDSLPEPLLKVG